MPPSPMLRSIAVDSGAVGSIAVGSRLLCNRFRIRSTIPMLAPYRLSRDPLLVNQHPAQYFFAIHDICLSGPMVACVRFNQILTTDAALVLGVNDFIFYFYQIGIVIHLKPPMPR